jgi:hypothetical protein
MLLLYCYPSFCSCSFVTAGSGFVTEPGCPVAPLQAGQWNTWALYAIHAAAAPGKLEFVSSLAFVMSSVPSLQRFIISRLASYTACQNIPIYDPRNNALFARQNSCPHTIRPAPNTDSANPPARRNPVNPPGRG